MLCELVTSNEGYVHELHSFFYYDYSCHYLSHFDLVIQKTSNKDTTNKNVTIAAYLWLQYFDCNNIKYSKCSFNLILLNYVIRSSYPEVFLGKGVLKVCSKLTGEHPC